MQLVPFQSFTYSSPLTLAQAGEQLKELFDLAPLRRNNEVHAWLFGELKGEGFRAELLTQSYRSSFTPVVYGTFQPIAGGTCVHLKLRMRKLVFTLVLLMVGWLLVDGVLILATGESRGIGIATLLIVSALLIWSGMMAGYRYDARKIERILGRTFDATITGMR